MAADESQAGHPASTIERPLVELADPSEQPQFLEVVDDGLTDEQSELLYRVRGAVDRYGPIRLSHSPIQVRWQDGTVVLQGRVRSVPMRLVAERLAQAASADHPLSCELLADPEVAVAVATALAVDARTNLAPVHVECNLGVVRLHGDVPTAAMAIATGELAATVPGVARVINDLVPGQEPAVAAAAEAQAAADTASPPTVEGEFTAEPRLEPHGRTQDANRVTRPQNGERVPISDT
jgi:osmotically-inducible protein OsmY